MAPKPGKKFCVEHGVSQREENEAARTPCPYDPKHTCYLSKLQKHLRKCNSRPKDLPPYVSPGVNAVDSEHPDARDEVYPIGDVPGDVLLDLVRKIEKVYSSGGGLECGRSVLSHPVVEPALEDAQMGMNTKKHLIQNSSLLKNMEANGFFGGNASFVEFGAGRGQLGFWIAQAVENSENCSLLLVDKASHRHKSDNKLKGASPVRTLRIRTDIADLDLSKVGLLGGGTKVYGVTKHLCGAATDLALRCLVNGKSNGLNVKGMVMAFCCHHRCTWTSFVGKRFLLDSGFSPNQFSALCSISSWATCGSGRPRSRLMEEEERKSWGGSLGLSREAREEVGRKCKMILNHARLKYLERFGFEGKLVYYVEANVSPENVCLIVKSNGGDTTLEQTVNAEV